MKEHAKIKCLGCGAILESLHRHDFVGCDCRNNTFVDGGYDYLRYGGVDLNLIQVIYTEKEYKPFIQKRRKNDISDLG
jgi:hypothetical protein